MASEVKAFVKQDEDTTWGGYCLGPGCGQVPFSTTQWPSQDVAEARIQQHLREHYTGEHMQLLSEFREEHGLVVNEQGLAVPEDAEEVTFDADSGS